MRFPPSLGDWSKTYYTLEFDHAKNCLSVKTCVLNVFQRIGRFFGAYQNTIWTQPKIDKLVERYKADDASLKNIEDLVKRINEKGKKIHVTLPHKNEPPGLSPPSPPAKVLEPEEVKQDKEIEAKSSKEDAQTIPQSKEQSKLPAKKESPPPAEAKDAREVKQEQNEETEIISTEDFSPLDTFTHTSISKATRFINEFDPQTKFSLLWSFVDGSPNREIPYSDLPATVENGLYQVSILDLELFIKDIDKSIETLLSLAEQIDPSLHPICENIVTRLDEIRETATLLIESVDMQEHAGLVLDEDTFASLKLEPKNLDLRLRIQLKDALEDLERKMLHQFYGELAHLTLNGGNNSHLVTLGLEKLRDFITSRSPRAKMVMDRGNMGVAEFVHEYCLKKLFGTSVLSEIVPDLKTMRNGNLTTVARPVNLHGLHFICYVETKEGLYALDSIGSKKTLIRSGNPTFTLENPEPATVCVGDAFYASCTPLSIDQISVPRQKENNCYLAAGWLTFSTFLYFYNQSIAAAKQP